MAVRRLGQLVCRAATTADRKALIPVLARSYLHEPTVSHTDVTMRECEEVSDLILHAYLPEGHSFVMEDAQDGIVSFVLCGDFGHQLPGDHPVQRYIADHRHFSVVGQLEDRLLEQYARMHGYSLHTFPLGHTLQGHMGGTEPEYRNQGLVRILSNRLLSHCWDCSFRFIVSNYTSKFSRRVGERYGVRTLATIRYRDWYPAGSVYARCAEDGHDAVRLMVKAVRRPVGGD